MLKYIITVTVIVHQLSVIEAPYRNELGYQTVHRGTVPAAQAELWAAPAMAGRAFVIMQPASGRPVYLRFIENPGTPVPEAGTTFGWNAIETLAQDPDALVRRFEGTAFRVVGLPRNLGNATDAPRAMQVVGPARELLYFTRIVPSGFPITMTPARTPVDSVFIMVVGGPSLTALQDFYGRVLGLPVGKPGAWPITTLSRALGLPLETTYPLAMAPLPRDFLIEMDEYPAQGVPRPVRPGSLPPGPAMVTFGVSELDGFQLNWRAPPDRIQEFPYNGQLAAAAVGPAGEWVELVEIAGLPAQRD